MSGKRLCRIEDIPDRQAKGFPIDGAEYDIFVYREDSTLRAFVNSCPIRARRWTGCPTVSFLSMASTSSALRTGRCSGLKMVSALPGRARESGCAPSRSS